MTIPDSESSIENLIIYKMALDSLSEGVIITKADQDNPIIYVNQQFLNETGYTMEEMLGKNPRFLQGPESDLITIEKVRDRISNKTPFRGEIVNYRKDGSKFFNLMTINPICNKNNETTHFVGLQSNIDYRIEMEKNLQLIHQRFNLAVKATKDVIWDWDFLKNNIKWESTLNDVFEYNLNNLETDPEWYFNRIHPDDRENVRNKLYDSLMHHKVFWDDEYRFQQKNENYKFIHDRAFIVYDEKNNPIRMIGAMQDLTTYKTMLNDQINLSKELSHSNKDLQQFGYILSHNLRGAIARIKGLVTVLEIEKFEFPDEIKVILSYLYQAAESLDKTMIDLIGILQIRTNFNELKEKVYYIDILNQVKETLQEQIIQSQAEIRHDFNIAPFLITIKSYIVSILYNLLSNAIKYRSPKRNLKISFRTYIEDNYIVLEVRDNGMGIDLNKQKDKIFGLYKRFHLHIEGKGMGLYLVKNQAESLGGRISIESKEDQGSIFKVYLKK